MKSSPFILLIDDNRMDIELTLDAFREGQFLDPIHVARNGQEGLDYLFGRAEYGNRTQYPLPNLILLDLKMPKIDGFEVLRQVKSTPILKRIPIIVLTSSREEADRAASYDYGANSYLVKPFSYEGIADVVRNVTEYWLMLNAEPPGVN
jgi:CheY-like chemotaxis protein